MANLAVLGGGIAGLTCAFRLLSEGHKVTLFEASDHFGGLGGSFAYEGAAVERFYHVMLDTDQALLGLVRELGLGPRLCFRETTMGFIVGGAHYPFNTPVDLLRFGALPWLARLRTGFGALYLTRLLRDGAPLDDRRAVDWLRGIFGDTVFRQIWEPLLTAKFGEQRDRVPAYWVWSLLRREKDGSQEVKAYVVGGYSLITDALVARIRELGGRLLPGCPVTALDSGPDHATLTARGGAPERFDAVIATLPLPLLRRVASATLSARLPLADLDYQGVANVLLVRREPLSRHYWTAVVDSDFPFQGVVETTRVIPPASLGDRHLVYVMNYCGPGHEMYDSPDDRLIERAVTGLARLYPDTGRSAPEAAFVFRAPYVEPIWTRGYLRARPTPHVSATRVYLCTTAQAYPNVTSWNTSVSLALATINQLRGDLE